jgi:hypothetical protein
VLKFVSTAARDALDALLAYATSIVVEQQLLGDGRICDGERTHALTSTNSSGWFENATISGL